MVTRSKEDDQEPQKALEMVVSTMKFLLFALRVSIIRMVWRAHIETALVELIQGEPDRHFGTLLLAMRRSRDVRFVYDVLTVLAKLPDDILQRDPLTTLFCFDEAKTSRVFDSILLCRSVLRKCTAC